MTDLTHWGPGDAIWCHGTWPTLVQVMTCCLTVQKKHYKSESVPAHFQWASCQILKLWFAHAPGMPGTFSPPPRVSDREMHHGTCVTHVPWCMSGSLTSGFRWNRWRGKTFPAFPAHAQPAILRIWQEAHCTCRNKLQWNLKQDSLCVMPLLIW